MESPPCYSTKMLADRWMCSKQHIRDLVKKKRLAYFTIGTHIRIRAEEVERWERATQNSSVSETDRVQARIKTEDAPDARAEPKFLVIRSD